MWKPIAAGILNIFNGVFIYVGTLLIFAIFYHGELQVFIIGIIALGIALLALMSGISALKREKWGLVMLGALAVLAISIFFFSHKSPFEFPTVFAWGGTPAFIFLVFSKNQFKRQKKNSEYCRNMGNKKYH